MLYQKNMIGGNFSNLKFQTFYTSKEVSACPLISDVVRIGKRFDDLKLYENIEKTVISFRYGRRLLINSMGSSIKDIKKEDFLEIVDYDPIKKLILAIGPKEPRIETPVHWLICHAKKEVNAIIQINNRNFAEKFEKKLPATDREYPSGTLDQAKEILGCLRKSDKIVIKNQGLIFVGNSSNEVGELVINTLE